MCVRWLLLAILAFAIRAADSSLNRRLSQPEHSWSSEARDVINNQQIVNNAIDHALKLTFNNGIGSQGYNSTIAGKSNIYEYIGGICPDGTENRLGCCEPSDTKYLQNVRIASGKLYIHKEMERDGSRRSLSAKRMSLPDIVSVQNRHQAVFKMDVVEQSGPFRHAACKTYFNGTLHVHGRVTAHNVYHAVADNLVPLAHQIMLDATLYPEMLHLPRIGLTGFAGHQGKELMAHLNIANDLMAAGMHDLNAFEGHCFRRVVWGYGAHIMYSDTLVLMRRLVSEFLRQFVTLRYPVSLPSNYYQHSLSEPAFAAPFRFDPSSKTKFKGLNIVMYTRGNSGQGRTMQHEDLIVKAFEEKGAKVVHCCDFGKATMLEQISYALYADVIMGVHGAALIHGLFLPRGGMIIELKTLYAFPSAVFQLVADARSGMLGQVDVREFWKPGGHNPINDWLVGRAINILSLALSRSTDAAQWHGTYQCLNVPTKAPDIPIDCVIGAIRVNPSTPELAHPLGPLQSNALQVCHSTVLYEFRHKEYKKESDDVHCNFCTRYTENTR